MDRSVEAVDMSDRSVQQVVAGVVGTRRTSATFHISLFVKFAKNVHFLTEEFDMHYTLSDAFRCIPEPN